ncbi:hypothetical protein [Helicobacter mesocricetorum]|uniref:hypothetical protein n=1 Tax=Helicobacter mesocricetorum TaxID=87012 RepID=UPI000CF1BEC4|nr:hypothetical protein [Helicobacter mesocricetorum]
MRDTELTTQQTTEVEQPQESLETQETQAQDEVEATQAQAESTLTPLALKRQEIEQKEDEIAALQNQLTELNSMIESLSKEEREQAYTPKNQQELVRAFYVDKTNNDLKERILEIIESIKVYLPPAKISTKQKQVQIDNIKQQITQKQESIDIIDEEISDDNEESDALREERQVLSGELEELNNELKVLKEQQCQILSPILEADLTTKCYVDMQLQKLLTTLQQADNQIQQTLNNHIQLANTKDSANVKLSGNQSISGVKSFASINATSATISGVANLPNPQCANNPTIDNHLTRKAYVDYGGGMRSLGNQVNARIDLRLAQHFHFTMTGRGNIGVSNWGGHGKSGTITIYRAENITGFLAPFSFRIPQSGFRGTETFAYFCVASNCIKLSRV